MGASKQMRTGKLGIVLQVWFWLTPIVYPVQILPASYAKWIWINPVTPIVQARPVDRKSDESISSPAGEPSSTSEIARARARGSPARTRSASEASAMRSQPRSWRAITRR